MRYVVVELTQGNINNSHLYLSSVIDFFPVNSIGGPNEDSLPELKLEIHNGIEQPLHTDIAGDKKYLGKEAGLKSSLKFIT